jgi:hypothetical protein
MQATTAIPSGPAATPCGCESRFIEFLEKNSDLEWYAFTNEDNIL